MNRQVLTKLQPFKVSIAKYGITKIFLRYSNDKDVKHSTWKFDPQLVTVVLGN